MARRQEVFIDLSDELKEQIAAADLGGLIELLADLLAEERIRELSETESNKSIRSNIEHD